jgi:hypothetical protein
VLLAIPIILLWQAEPLLDNDREISNYIPQPLLRNGFASRHEHNNSTATRGYNNNGKPCFLRGHSPGNLSRTSDESFSEELVGE